MAVKPTLNSSSNAPMMRKSNVAAGPLPSMKMSGVLVADAPRGRGSRNDQKHQRDAANGAMFELVALAGAVASHDGNLLLFVSPSCLEGIPNVGAASSAAGHSGFLIREVSLSLPPANQARIQELETWGAATAVHRLAASDVPHRQCPCVVARGRASFAKHTTAPAPRR